MGEVIPISDGDSSGVATPAWTEGQKLFTTIVDELNVLGVMIPRSAIAVAVKHGKQALEEGVDPEAVVVGCLMALRQGKGRFAVDYIAEVAVVKSGHHLSRKEYEQLLSGYKAQSGPAAAERSLLSRVLGDRKEDS